MKNPQKAKTTWLLEFVKLRVRRHLELVDSSLTLVIKEADFDSHKLDRGQEPTLETAQVENLIEDTGIKLNPRLIQTPNKRKLKK